MLDRPCKITVNAFSLLLWLHIFIIIVIIIITIMECVFKIVSIHLFYDTQTVDRLYFFGGFLLHMRVDPSQFRWL